jgi:hypothetical protein
MIKQYRVWLRHRAQALGLLPLRPERTPDHPANHIGVGWGTYIVRGDGGWLYQVDVPPPDKYTKWN